MKKLAVASAVLTALTATAAFAEVTVDVYGDRSTKSEFGNKSTQGVEVGYGFGNGLALSAEATTNKDLDLDASWKFNYSEQSYVKPSIGYVFKDSKTTTMTNPNLPKNQYEFVEFSGEDSNVAKLGLEFGSDLGKLFTSARIRYEMNTDKYSVKHEEGNVDSKGKHTATFSETRGARSEIARIDVMAGYRFDGVTVSAKGITKTEVNKDLRRLHDLADIDRTKSSYEFKAMMTAYDGVTPYVQYAINTSNISGVANDHVIKIGTKFTF
ncbi:hypothetical protein L4D20_11790 [Vibrio kyushuensis]|uniref:hypothetical protein n=1 Tax=Vibrio kyushuensis TaxID=2910249 RepID=UPI003D14CF7F